MQYSHLAIFAVAGVASAANVQERQNLQDISPSLINVLITALPPSILAQAATAPDAVYSDIVSSINAGNTPAWYAALPTDVQSLLAGQAAPTAGATVIAVAPAQTSIVYAPSVGSMVTPSVGSMVTPSVGSMVTPSVGSMVTPSVGSMVTSANTPGAPGVPSAPGVPGTPGTPGTPSAPGVPGAPGSAASPSASGPVLQSTNAAAMPSAVVGSGIAAGLFALAGMLAL